MSKGAFKNFKFKELSFKNKVVMAPESSNSASKDGRATEFHFNHYSSKALNGVGTVVVEGAATEMIGRKSDKDLGIWHDKHIKGLKKIASSINKKEVIAGIQLYHSGVVNNTDINDMEALVNISEKEIKTIIKSFKKATKRAVKAGFDFVEIKGEFISRFLAKEINSRKDIYGGSFENRARVISEVVSEVRSVLPKDKVLAVRLYAELYEDRKEKEELGKLIELLRAQGVDLINLSSESEELISSRAARKIKTKLADEKELPVVEGGLINIALDSSDIVNSKKGLAFLGKAILRDSYWVINEMKSFVYPNRYSLI
ncbi:MAG: hypothetical protein ACRCYE_00475 [Sarcina sp.]